ncbi:MAG: DUF1622 domain-containing protein [bacterium]|nr:DUF1622 domain-containing protein [bacterium]
MQQILENIAFVISVVSLCIIAYGSLIALFQFIKNELSRFSGKFTFTEISVIRLQLGYYLLLGLEFLIASDIIRTIIDPTDQDLIVLGGIVVIRTVLTYFLNREIQQPKTVDSKDL